MKRLFGIVLFLVLIVSMAGFAGSGPEEKPEELTFAYMSGIADPFMFMIEKGAQAKADELGVKLMTAEYPKAWGPEHQVPILEAMAARCPVVVSEVGGLQDVVKHAETGITVYSDDPDSLAWGILHTLQYPEWAASRVKNAYKAVREEYNWERIARMTADMYGRIISEAAIAAW